jgi:hypothetical protein
MAAPHCVSRLGAAVMSAQRIYITWRISPPRKPVIDDQDRAGEREQDHPSRRAIRRPLPPYEVYQKDQRGGIGHDAVGMAPKEESRV